MFCRFVSLIQPQMMYTIEENQSVKHCRTTTEQKKLHDLATNA